MCWLKSDHFELLISRLKGNCMSRRSTACSTSIPKNTCLDMDTTSHSTFFARLLQCLTSISVLHVISLPYTRPAPTPFSFARCSGKKSLFMCPLHHLFHICSVFLHPPSSSHSSSHFPGFRSSLLRFIIRQKLRTRMLNNYTLYIYLYNNYIIKTT